MKHAPILARPENAAFGNGMGQYYTHPIYSSKYSEHRHNDNHAAMLMHYLSGFLHAALMLRPGSRPAARPTACATHTSACRKPAYALLKQLFDQAWRA
jgi:hypothetical protein